MVVNHEINGDLVVIFILIMVFDTCMNISVHISGDLKWNKFVFLDQDIGLDGDLVRFQ